MGMGLSSSGDDAGMVLTALDGLAGAAEDARGAGADEDEEEEDGDGEDGCDGEDADQVEDDWALEEEADVERQRERIDAEPRCAEVEACADERLRNRPATPVRQLGEDAMVPKYVFESKMRSTSGERSWKSS
jgi:hypothetical protein